MLVMHGGWRTGARCHGLSKGNTRLAFLGLFYSVQGWQIGRIMPGASFEAGQCLANDAGAQGSVCMQCQTFPFEELQQPSG